MYHYKEEVTFLPIAFHQDIKEHVSQTSLNLADELHLAKGIFGVTTFGVGAKCSYPITIGLKTETIGTMFGWRTN